MSPDAPLPEYLESFISQQEATLEPTRRPEELRPGEWRGLWTWIELVDGEILPASLEILGRGRELSEELGSLNCAVLFGRDVESAAARLGEYGAHRTYVLDGPEYESFSLRVAREALLELIRERRPEALFLPASVQGRNLGAHVAAALGAGIVPNCAGLTLDPTERAVIGHQTSYEERLLSDVVCPVQRPQIFTISPGKFRRPSPEPGRAAQVVPVTLREPPTAGRVRVLERLPPKELTLEKYDAVVAGGLGLASAEGFRLTQELAAELNAYAGATRGAVACGWAEADRLISATKHRLRPRLYVACGVVGEYDHLKAIEGTDLVVALTNDPGSPIAENADLIGLGDPTELLRRVVGHLREARKDRLTLA